MKVILDESGHIAIPDSILDELNLGEGSEFKIELNDGVIHLAPIKTSEPAIIREGNTLVVQCEPEQSGKLKNLVSEMREARIASIIDVISQ